MEMDPLVKKLLLEEEGEEDFDEEAFVASLLNDEIEVYASPSQPSDNESTVPAWSTASMSASSSKQTVTADYDNLFCFSAANSVIKAPPKKPSVGQKKPLETLVSPPLPSSKKQKVSGTFLDQSIDQLNDVTGVSGVNLREEEERLLSRPKEDSCVSEAHPPVVQEEEERLILEKIPIGQKLAKTMAKSGIKNMSNNVERCLSLAAEERLRGVVCNPIRLSKQENKEEDDKPRITAANVVVRAAVGGDDMLSKWQLMAEQAKQKRVGLGAVRKVGRNQGNVPPQPQETPSNTIPRKGLTVVFEREPQMAKSALFYKLYDRQNQ